MTEPEHAKDKAKGGAGPLTKKIGGQPAWLWIVGVVVLMIGVQWYRQRAAAVTAAATTATKPVQDPATMGTGTLPAGAGTPTATAGPHMSTREWLTAALNAAKNAGEDPLHASRALGAFLNGGDLTVADQNVVNAAVDAVGLPPGVESIPPGTWATKTPPPPSNQDVAIVRLIRPAGQPGIFAEYADNSVRWIQNTSELSGIVHTNPALVNHDTNNAVITDLPVSDPTFNRATYGVGGVDAYHAAGGGTSTPGGDFNATQHVLADGSVVPW